MASSYPRMHESKAAAQECLLELEMESDNRENRQQAADQPRPSDARERVDESSRVSFGSIQILTFLMEPGDNPSVTRGCPLTIGWEPLEKTISDVESYERLRPSEGRRSSKELRLSTERRTQILLEQGHSPREISAKAVAATRAKESRLLTLQNRNKKFDLLYGALARAGQRVAAKAANI